MNRIIRIAKEGDAASIVRIKNALPLRLCDGSSTTGGFLLGTDIETYRTFIREAHCLVAEVAGDVVGFGIVLRDESLRRSDVWQRRHTVEWQIDIQSYEAEKNAYFEQLAFLPGHKRMVLQLAHLLACRSFDEGHTYLFTTTVRKPVLNLAAVPFIKAASGLKAGNIDEIYPDVGHINSDIYIMNRYDYYQAVESHNLYPLFRQAQLHHL